MFSKAKGFISFRSLLKLYAKYLPSWYATCAIGGFLLNEQSPIAYTLLILFTFKYSFTGIPNLHSKFNLSFILLDSSDILTPPHQNAKSYFKLLLAK